MVTTQVQGSQFDHEIQYGCGITKRLIRVLPRAKGIWFLGTNLIKLLPRHCQAADLFLSCRNRPRHIEFDLRDPTQFSMMKNNQLDLMTASVIGSVLKEGDTFIDVGANWGYFTCLASQVIGLTGKVVALEPNSQAHERLCETVRRHRLPNVITMNYAAYDCVGERVSLQKSFYRQTTSSYVRKARDDGHWGTITTTLDYVSEKIARGIVRLVKVDTEGAELPVMKGAQALLKESKPLCMLEVSSYGQRFNYAIKDLYGFMRGLGYSRAYSIVDRPEALGLSGPLREAVEGQIMFCHDDEDLVVA